MDTIDFVITTNGSEYSTEAMFNSSIKYDDDETYKEFYENAQFLTGIVFYPIFCFVGLIGNSLVLIVLSHKKMASSTNTYLRAFSSCRYHKAFK